MYLDFLLTVVFGKGGNKVSNKSAKFPAQENQVGCRFCGSVVWQNGKTGKEKIWAILRQTCCDAF